MDAVRGEATMREIATALRAVRRTIYRRAASEGWPYREQRVRGGRRRLYPVASLPADVRAALGEREEDPLCGGNGCPATSPAHPAGMKSGEGAPPNQETPTSIPSRARTRGEAPDPPPPDVDPALEASLAAHFDGLTAARRAECEALVLVVDRAVAMAARSKSRSMRPALEAAAAELDCERSPRTLYSAWLGRRGRPGLKSLPRRLWAAALAPRYIGCTAIAECSSQAWEAWKADYLRAEQPTAAHSHRLVLRLAGANGWSAPRSAATFLRRLRREVPVGAIVLARQGPEAAKRLVPAQQRDHQALRAMECLNADGHRWDVMVEWPSGRPRKARPMGVFWQDVFSGDILGWRIGREETSDAYRESFGDVLRDHGIPGAVILDNGRGACAKALAGGSAHSYRGKALAGDPVGLLTQLVGPDGIHRTKPYSGQSKKIERAFLDFSRDIAKDVRLAGAYTGPSTERKPHNHGSRAIPLAEFERVVADGVRLHNARRGRRGMGMRGRSFDEVFAESAAAHAGEIPRPTAAQLEQWLLTPQVVTARSSDGAVHVHGNRYWVPELARALAGKPADRRRVVVRYDATDLTRPPVVEDLDGRLIARAELRTAAPVLDADSAKQIERERKRAAKLDREQLRIHKRLSARELVAMVDAAAGTEAQPKPPAMAKVMTGAFGLEGPEPPAERKESPADILILEAVRAAGGGSL